MNDGSKMGVRLLTLWVTVASLAVAVPAVAKAAKEPADYLVASFTPPTLSGGENAVITHLGGELCITPPPSPLESPPCDFVSGWPTVMLTPLAVSGTTIWADTHSTAFADLVNEITNGLPGRITWELTTPSSIFLQDLPESFLFDGDIGPTGVDLAGYKIDRVGFRIDQVMLDTPGRNPNGDGVWTDYQLTGTFLFEGRIASKEACMRGGWQSLHGPNRTSFANQGGCIRLVARGG